MFLEKKVINFKDFDLLSKKILEYDDTFIKKLDEDSFIKQILLKNLSLLEKKCSVSPQTVSYIKYLQQKIQSHCNYSLSFIFIKKEIDYIYGERNFKTIFKMNNECILLINHFLENCFSILQIIIRKDYLRKKYGQLYSHNFIINKIKKDFQKNSEKVYKRFSEGELYSKITKLPIAQYSKKNLDKHKHIFNTRSTYEEKEFLEFIFQKNFNLQHCTNDEKLINIQGDAKIISAREILKIKKFNEKNLKNTDFLSNITKNHPKKFGINTPWINFTKARVDDFVYFHIIYSNLTPPFTYSPYVNNRIIFNPNEIDFFEHGFVSCDVFHLNWICTDVNLDPNDNLRKMNMNSQSVIQDESGMAIAYEANVSYPKTGKIIRKHIFENLFYGKDIKQGMWISFLNELRLIGGNFQKEILKIRDLEKISQFLIQVLGYEAKLPHHIHTKFLRKYPGNIYKI